MEIYPGFAAAEVLYARRGGAAGTAVGVATGDMGMGALRTLKLPTSNPCVLLVTCSLSHGAKGGMHCCTSPWERVMRASSLVRIAAGSWVPWPGMVPGGRLTGQLVMP